MIGLVARRLLRTVLTLLGVLTVTFFLMHLNGNPAALMLPESANTDDIRALDAALGFDRPLLVQYFDYLDAVLHGRFGLSLRQGVPALSLVLSRMPATIELAASSFVTGFGVAGLLAIVTQLTRSDRLRDMLLWLGVLRQAVPSFVFAVLGIYLFAVELGWLPSMGGGGITHLVLPTLTVATFEATLYFRLMDWSLSQERSRDYVRTARAKGAGHRRVVLRHMLPNALLPVMTVAGVNLGGLLGGLLVIEKVFNWPGIGSLVVDSVNGRDFPVVQAGVVAISVAFMAINLTVDMLYAAIDPRLARS